MKEIQPVMNQKEYEDFVNLVNNLTEEQKWVAIRAMPAEMLWQDLYSRYQDQEQIVNAMKDTMRLR